MEKLLESFNILGSLGTQILFLIEAHETALSNADTLSSIKFKGHYSNHPFANSISSMALNYSLLMCCSFIDEYNEYFTASKHPHLSARILRLKKVTKPVMRRINKWTDLKEYRNVVLAHNFRSKGTSLFSPDAEPRHFNIPHTDNEIVLLSRLITIIGNCIVHEFPEIRESIDFSENLQRRMKFSYPKVDVEEEVANIWREINEVKQTI